MNYIPDEQLFNKCEGFYKDYYKSQSGSAVLESEGVIDWLCPDELPDIVEWVEQNIDLSRDQMSEAQGKIDLQRTPYCIQPLKDWMDPAVRQSSSVAGEQTAKSTAAYCGQIYVANFGLGPMQTMYPSADLASEINEDRIEPLMEGIPKLAASMKKPKTKTKSHYKLPGATWYFTGAGSPTIAKSYKYGVMEEIDFWNEDHQADDYSKKGADKIQVSNEVNMKKRQFTYEGKGAYTMSCCSPTLKSAKSWKMYLKSSQGSWHFNCQNPKCQKMFSSCTVRPKLVKGKLIGGIRYAEEDGEIIVKSIRVECPHCQYRHTRKQLRKMNDAGDYRHLKPKRKAHRGYRWGRLAAEFADECWLKCAEALKWAREDASREAQMNLAQSYESKPYDPISASPEKELALMSHCADLPTKDKIKWIFFAADTQDTGFYYIIRGFDAKFNSYLLDYGFCKNQNELMVANEFTFHGMGMENSIIDQGGTRGREVQEMVADIKGFYTYKGNPRACVDKKWRWSKTDDKLILGHPHKFQGDVLFNLYQQNDRSNHYWFLPKNLEPDYIAQLLDHRGKPGEDYEDWKSSGNDHYFDCEKMMICLTSMVFQMKGILETKKKRKKKKKTFQKV